MGTRSKEKKLPALPLTNGVGWGNVLPPLQRVCHRCILSEMDLWDRTIHHTCLEFNKQWNYYDEIRENKLKTSL